MRPHPPLALVLTHEPAFTAVPPTVLLGEGNSSRKVFLKGDLTEGAEVTVSCDAAAVIDCGPFVESEAGSSGLAGWAEVSLADASAGVGTADVTFRISPASGADQSAASRVVLVE